MIRKAKDTVTSESKVESTFSMLQNYIGDDTATDTQSNGIEDEYMSILEEDYQHTVKSKQDK